MVWCRLVSALTQRLLGGLIGLFEAAFLKFYQYVVDPADPGTWPIRFFTWAATGPIKYALVLWLRNHIFPSRPVAYRANTKISCTGSFCWVPLLP